MIKNESQIGIPDFPVLPSLWSFTVSMKTSNRPTRSVGPAMCSGWNWTLDERDHKWFNWVFSDQYRALKPPEPVTSRVNHHWTPSFTDCYLNRGFVLCTMPSLVWSLAFVKSTSQSLGKVSGSTAKPWFWLVMKQRSVPLWMHGWLCPRLPYLRNKRK